MQKNCTKFFGPPCIITKFLSQMSNYTQQKFHFGKRGTGDQTTDWGRGYSLP